VVSEVGGNTGDFGTHFMLEPFPSWLALGRIVVYPAFVDKARCEMIIKMASKQMYPSGLAYR
jgi:prolyl 4-hydroxylase